MHRRLFVVPLVAVATALVIAACGGNSQSPTSEHDQSLQPSDGAAVGKLPAATAIAPRPSSAPSSSAIAGPGGPAGAKGVASDVTGATVQPVALQDASRQVIVTANLTVEVQDIDKAVNDARAIAQAQGGLVEQLTSSGGPDRKTASITVRVPQPNFTAAMQQLEGLGSVKVRNLGSQDVTEQFIDLQARLKSSQQAEQSFLTLLSKAQSVGDVLTVERELTRVRSDIERMQGQLNFLQRRVDLATITVSLVTPDQFAGTPPKASLGVEVRAVQQAVDAMKALATRLNGSVTSVVVRQQGDTETADVTVSVYRADFRDAVASATALGKVTRKEVNEGASTIGNEPPKTVKPDALIQVSLSTLPQKESNHRTLVIALASALPAALVAAGVAVLLARRRSPSSATPS
ncbi:MAG: DUF4349 domain-containing protein [Chloroflexi bacterium]|nr:DUF4349 domain-containing protein [Chloroflexota bacterium]